MNTGAGAAWGSRSRGRRQDRGNDGGNDTRDGDAGMESAEGHDDGAIAKDKEQVEEEEEEEVCCREKGFDRARRAGLIDAVAWKVVEHDCGGVGAGVVGVGVGVGRKLPLGRSLLTLMCRVKL
ncbi:hypothetical protein VE04_02432 [Pseudogymnoascus sp. 24MN13]|nr:hypothetical protein VE04_02432 [Pseudogymnoascus sp. 24MN13]